MRRGPNISRRVFMSRGGSRGVVICIYIYLTLNSGGYIHIYISYIKYFGGLRWAPNISRRVFMSRVGSRGVVICIYIFNIKQ